MLREENLHQYQLNVIDRIVAQKRLALWLDMGLGKTIITLTAIRRLIDAGEIHSALVVAPKTVTETVWAQEAAQWEHTSSLRISVVTGTEKQRKAALVQVADVYVIARDNLAWLSTQEEFAADMLVVDESTSLKDRSTQRWAAVCQKSVSIRGKKYTRKTAMIDTFKRVVLLSGTPASESYSGLWAQIYLLDKGERLGKTISVFRQQYMIAQQFGFSRYPVYTHMRTGAIDAINDKLSDICISMRSDDYLTLPERIDVIRHVNANDKYYRLMERDGVINVECTDIIAGDTLTKYTKLQQISSGFVYDEHGKVYELNHNKIDTLTELLEGTDENVLVMYKYQHENDTLQKLGGVSLDNPQAIAAWQRGEIRLGLLYPASGGYGLNLASGGSIVVWYTLPLSLEQYLQANKRIHRQGQTKTVRVYHLLGTGTIDEHIYELLQSKQDVLDGLMKFFSV